MLSLQRKLAILLSLIALPCSSAAPIVHAGIQLTPEAFETSIAEGPWLVEFFSPYCGHCKHFAPTWKDFVDTERTTSDAKFAQVDCAAFGDLCKQQGVQAWPTMLLYQGGVKTREFPADQVRTLENLEAFIEKYAPRMKEEAVVPAQETPSPEKTPTPSKGTLVIQSRKVNEEGAVRILDSKSIADAVSGEMGPIFIKFYAPWCGHCKAMAPAWRDLASDLQNKINVAELDCDAAANRQACTQQGIKSFPTLIMYVGGHRREYNGARTIGPMRLFAERAALSSGLQVMPAGGLDEARQKHDVFFLLLGAEDPRSRDMVDSAAQTLFGAAPVFQSSDPSADTSLSSGTEGPSLVVFKANLGAPLARRRLQAEDTSASVSDWLRDWRLPLVMELTGSSMRDLVEDGSGQRIVLASLPNEAKLEATNQLQDIAKQWADRGEHAGPTRFAWADSKRLERWLKQSYGIKSAAKPAVVLIEPHLLRYYARDASGLPFSLDRPVQLFHALEAHNLGKLWGVKYTLSRTERFALLLGKQAQRVGGTIGRHPVLAVILIAGSFVGGFMLLVSLLDPPDRGRQYEKKD